MNKPLVAISADVYVSTQGLVREDDEISKVIAACLWEATSFRFTYGWFPFEVK